MAVAMRHKNSKIAPAILHLLKPNDLKEYF
jgi:hypothetical protein